MNKAMRKKFFAGKKNLFFVFMYLSDVAMYFGSAILAATIMRLDLGNIYYTKFFLFSLVILLINYGAYKLYKDKRNLFDDNDFMKILYSVSIAYFVLMVFVIMFLPDSVLYLRFIGALTLTMVLTCIFTSISRFVWNLIIKRFRHEGYDRKRTMFFGNNNSELIQKIRDNESLGYDIVKITKDVSELKANLRNVDIVFLTMEHIDDKMLETMIQNDRISWKIIPPVLNLVIDPVSFDEFKDYPIINVSNRKLNKGYMTVKRLMDIALSGLALVILSPLLLVVAAAIKISMPGPVFFKQERLGKNLRPFQVYKFRTMVVGADEQKKKLKSETKGLFKIKDDPRITPLGKFLRRSGIDELAQLINIFKGDMSIVGPRPHLQIELHNFKGWRMTRFKVKPGLTGMWQVNGRHELNFDKAVLYDIYYIKHLSFVLDLSIILKTIPAIVMSRGRY
jgi:exopolysaccharide biosynthesis polyprenyl glycosylphosphotransferase